MKLPRPNRFDGVMLAALLCLTGEAILAQARGTGHTVTSRSRQFTVSHSLTQPALQPPTPLGRMPQQVQLTSAKLVLFAEELRAQVHARLKLPPQTPWTGRIHLNIIPGKAEDPVVVQRRRFTDRWTYRLDLPEIMAPDTLARSLIAVLLEEMAGRNSTQVPPLPPWLAEGLSEIILQYRGPVLFSAFQNIAGGVSNHQFTSDPMASARQTLKSKPPLSFLNLTLPPAHLQNAEGRQLLRANSHLLVHKILRQQNGSKTLRAFLQELPRHRNNQHAFMTAMGFKSMLQAEQWWSVAQIQFRSRDAMNRWYPQVALDHLSNALNIPMSQVDNLPGKPRTVFLSLPQFMKEAPDDLQRTQLTALIQQLLVIQLNAPPNVARLVQDYRATLRLYLGPAIALDPESTVRFNETLRNQCIAQITRLNIIQTDLKTLAKQENEKAKLVPEVKTPE